MLNTPYSILEWLYPEIPSLPCWNASATSVWKSSLSLWHCLATTRSVKHASNRLWRRQICAVLSVAARSLRGLGTTPEEILLSSKIYLDMGIYIHVCPLIWIVMKSYNIFNILYKYFTWNLKLKILNINKEQWKKYGTVGDNSKTLSRGIPA